MDRYLLFLLALSGQRFFLNLEYQVTRPAPPPPHPHPHLSVLAVSIEKKPVSVQGLFTGNYKELFKNISIVNIRLSRLI